MTLKDRAKQSADNVCDSGPTLERLHYIIGYKSAYMELKYELIDFLKANRKLSIEQVIKHLEGL